MRRCVLGLVLVLVVAACGGDATDDSIPPEDTVAVTTDAPDVDLASVVLGSELADRGMSPVEGESGEVTTDILPADSVMRVMLEDFGVADGYAAVFATPDGEETIIVAAILFDSESGAAEALTEFERIRSDIDTASDPVIMAATGEPLLGSCASLDRVEQTDAVLTVWLNTTECHTWDEDSPTTEIDCPTELAVGDTAEVVVTVPSHYEPLAWQVDADSFYWQEPYQLVLGEQTVTGTQIRLSITVTDEFSVAGTEADLRAILFTYSDIPAFGGTYRISGPRVAAECTIGIVAAAP